MTAYPKPWQLDSQVVVLYYHRSVRDDNEDRRLVTLLRQKGLLEELMWHGALILWLP